MKITWDEPKRLANLDKHGLDFADLGDDYFMTAVFVAAKRGRFMAIGRRADGTLTVIFARLGTEGLSIISMRPANRVERRLLNASEEN